MPDTRILMKKNQKIKKFKIVLMTEYIHDAFATFPEDTLVE